MKRRGLARRAVVVSMVGAAGMLVRSAGFGTGRAGAAPDPGTAVDPLRYVDPMIGTLAPGNTIPGAQLPFGFASVSPDTLNPSTAGYRADQDIIGFSHTHVSGAGGGGLYGNFRLTPLVGAPRVDDLASPKDQETAAPGYYSVLLTRYGVTAELSASRRAGIHRYTFPATAQARLVLDATSVVFDPASGRTGYQWQRPVSSRVAVVAPDRVDGAVTVAGGYSYAPYTLYFSLVLDRPAGSALTFVDGTLGSDATVDGGDGQRTGAVLGFDTTRDRVVTVRLGVSFVSVAQAHQNLRTELGGSVADTAAAARAQWRTTLGTIAVDGGTEAQRTLLYTGLYHAHVMPHDLTGENVWTDAHIHYEDYYTLWDTFRTVHPLLTLLQPEREREMVATLVDLYRSTGWLPTGRTAGQNGLQQVGTHADTVLADVLGKGLLGVDYATAYRGMVNNAEQAPPYPVVDGAATVVEGRPGLTDYKSLGYVPVEFVADARPSGLTQLQASRTVEYAYNDFCLAQVARALGHPGDYRKYLARSGNWANLWDDQTQSIRPRHADGSWVTPFDPAVRLSPNAAFYEGSGYQYTTFVPHDVQGLINRLGGDVGMVAWLDRLFDNGDPAAASNGYYSQYNEHDLLAAYLYIHAGRPDRTADRVRTLLATQYTATDDGLHGNDDSGAMSAWYVWGALGLYPNAGQPYYYIGSPLFTRSRISLFGGRVFTITAAATSDTNRYVRSAVLNGRPLERAWLHHHEVARGGVLDLRMGDSPSTWGQTDRPPSVSPPG